MPAPKNNRFAAKSPDEKLSSTLYVRLREREKQQILEAAGTRGVTAWARDVLLKAAQLTSNDRGEPTRAANRYRGR